MIKDIYCPIIHGGLNIDIKNNTDATINTCCLRKDHTNETDLWTNSKFIQLRQQNDNGIWDPGCWQCESNENAGLPSFRTGMIQKLGRPKNQTGPSRLDLMFDISCNLACRTCGPHNSTFWQQYLKTNNIPFSVNKPIKKIEEMIGLLEALDLTNLQMVVYCGGETLLGNSHWRLTEYLLGKNLNKQIELCFQTNGTQTISKQNLQLLEKFKSVKLHISLDGVDQQFEYLRWPAKWQQVTENLNELRSQVNYNVEFLIEETISVLNWYSSGKLSNWKVKHFFKDRFNRNITHSRHLAFGFANLSAITQKYYDAMKNTRLGLLAPKNFIVDQDKVDLFLKSIEHHDALRSQDWRATFPQVYEFYK